MLKKQSDGAWLLSAPGIWEGVPPLYCRACGAFLHSSIDHLFPVECNGKSHIVQWKVGLHRKVDLYANGIFVWPLLQESLAVFAPLRSEFLEKTPGNYKKVWPPCRN